MIKIKKIIIFAIITCTMTVCCLKFDNIDVRASSNNNYFSEQEYTDNDDLLTEKGELSDKNITEFATETKNLANGQACPEITQVIPRQYMESTEQNAVFRYNGKEYGFYVVKTGSRFDVLLIDFIYDFDDEEHNNEYIIRISPILQQTFLRIDNGNGGYTYQKFVSSGNYRYYVANPRFAAGLKNEHSLNFGDDDYNKQDDNGPIIQQTRVNYGKVGYKTEGDFWELQSEFMATKLLDYVTDGIFECADYFTFGIASQVGKLIKLGVDVTEHAFDVYNQGQEATIRANNEENIFTNLSKTDQLNDPSIKSFSRAAYFMPKDELLLSADEESYAEFITVLNDTNENCRLMQVCDFDIVRRTNNWSSMEKVDGYNADNAFTFYRERVLFDKSYEIEKDLMSYYINKNGTQIYTFTPKYTGRYTVSSNNDSVNVKINDVEYGSSAENLLLKRGENYKIAFVSDKKAVGAGNIKLSETSNDTEIAPLNNYVMKFRPENTGIYRISAEGTRLSVHKDIFDADEIVTQSDDGTLIAVLQSKVDYYIVADNLNPSAIKMFTITEKTNATQINYNKHTTIRCAASSYEYFKFYAPYADKYDFVFSSENLENVDIDIISADNAIMAADKGKSDNTLYLNDLSMKNRYYFLRVYSSTDVTLDCYVNRGVVDCEWYINGSRYDAVALRRGNTYSIELRNKYNEKIVNKTLMIEKTYSDYAEVVKNGDGYTLTINGDAKLFNDDLTYYCTIYAEDDKDVSLSFPVAFQYSDLELKWKPLNEFENETISFKCPSYQGETSKMYCSYLFDGRLSVDYCISVTNETKYDVTKIKNFELSYLFLNDFKIKYIETYKDGILIGKTYNSALPEYSDKINCVNIDTLNAVLHYESGDGTSSNPFIINNGRQFQHVEYAARNGELNYNFFVKNARCYGGIMVPMFNCTLNAVFDGNNYLIEQDSNSRLSTGDRALFQKIGSRGVLKNIKINVGFNQNTDTDKSSAVLTIENYGLIENCNVAGIINNESGTYVGGIAAKNYGQINHCVFSGNISGGKYFGGIAGYNEGTISNCVAKCTMYYNNRYTDNDYIGGIVGYFENGRIEECTFSGEILIYVKDWESRTYQPYVAQIAAYKNVGSYGSNYSSGTVNVDNLNPDVTWKEFLFVTKHFNQRENVN